MQIKQSLEEAVGLKPVLLTKALHSVAQSAKELGMLTHLAPRLLPLCTFTADYLHVPQHQLLTHVQRLRMEKLVFSPDQLAAAKAAVIAPGAAQASSAAHLFACAHMLPMLEADCQAAVLGKASRRPGCAGKLCSSTAVQQGALASTSLYGASYMY